MVEHAYRREGDVYRVNSLNFSVHTIDGVDKIEQHCDSPQR